jgi:hypothetical protein
MAGIIASEQIARYWDHYGLVLVTNYRAFTLIGRTLPVTPWNWKVSRWPRPNGILEAGRASAHCPDACANVSPNTFTVR